MSVIRWRITCKYAQSYFIYPLGFRGIDASFMRSSTNVKTKPSFPSIKPNIFLKQVATPQFVDKKGRLSLSILPYKGVNSFIKIRICEISLIDKAYFR